MCNEEMFSIDFSNKELTILYKMISIALLSGNVELDGVVESIHRKVTGELALHSDRFVETGMKNGCGDDS